VRQQTDPWRLHGLAHLTVHPVDLVHGPAVRMLVGRLRPDVIFHLARQRGVPSALDYDAASRTNVDGTRHLLEAVRDQCSEAVVIHAGSLLEYGASRSPLHEDMPLRPSTSHGMTKAAATSLVQRFAREHRIRATTLRLFMVYGAWEGAPRFVPRLMRAALCGTPIGVTRAGLRRDWIHVDDAVDALLAASRTAQASGQIVNVATGRETANEDLVAAVEELTGRRLSRVPGTVRPRPWDAAHWVADVTRARAVLGWSAKRDLRAGLADTLAWFRTHMPAYEGRW
jgi:nucleoside-diphosphate-sugar epimerase